MDLHLTDAVASAEERSAVDSEPGVEVSSGNGDSIRRDRLLPVLHAVQNRIGWISPGAVNYVALRLGVPPAEVYGVASFYGMFSLQTSPPVVAYVCDDVACRTRGAEQLCADLEGKLGPAGASCHGGRATWLRNPCLGLCERAPAALIRSAGQPLREQVLAPASTGAVQSSLGEGWAGKIAAPPDAFRVEISVPQAATPSAGSRLRLLHRIAQSESNSLDDYLRSEGYRGLRRSFDLGPEGVLRELSTSKLLGRGGAAFPTAAKWQALFAQRAVLEKDSSRAHYLVCNADESEPGTFKDRILMEGDSFALIEGMTIGAFVTGARRGYLYVRGEYPLAADRMQHAVMAARSAGFLGENILGRDLSFDIEVRRGAGAYICGEETALFNSIEGYRGEPRNKPPFPTQSGLFRQPTAVNNVETLVNVPVVIREGGSVYATLGTEHSTGTRLFCLSGHVSRPGVYEVVLGTTLRELIDLAGGVAGGRKLQAVLLGGAAGTFVSPQDLDTPLTFEGARAIGATLGSGVVMLFDDTVDLRRILLRIAEFFRHETCGQCVPCRIGVVRQHEALERLINVRPLGSTTQELALIREMAQAMRDASICGLGQTASSALESALRRWSLFA